MTTEDRKALEQWWNAPDAEPFQTDEDLAWQAWQAATARERERCTALVEAGLGRTNTSIARSIRLPGSVAAHETTTNPVVDHKPENIEHKPEPPADLVERAKERFKDWVFAIDYAAPSIAAFAAEYAEEVADKLKRCDQDRVYRGKLLRKVRTVLYAIETDDEGDRVYFASTNDADMLSALAATLEDWHWDEIMREGALPDLAENCRKANLRAEAAEKALVEECEACAKVSDEHAARSVLLSETTAEDTVLLHGAEAMAAQRIAAAIRARKGGEDE